MSRFFPHTSFAEDQSLSHTILTTHVLTRATTTGSILGTVYASILSRSLLPPSPTLLSSSCTGVLFSIGVSTVGMLARMRGREDIEWKDRSWRLLENEGQLETDDWTYVGMLGGLGGLFAMRRGRKSSMGVAGGSVVAGWKGYIGAAGLGSVVGMVGYLGWRYGVNGGRFPVRKTEEKSI